MHIYKHTTTTAIRLAGYIYIYIYIYIYLPKVNHFSANNSQSLKVGLKISLLEDGRWHAASAAPNLASAACCVYNRLLQSGLMVLGGSVAVMLCTVYQVDT